MQQPNTPVNNQEQITFLLAFINSWHKLNIVCSRYGHGKSWVYSEIEAGRFPPPKKFGRSSRWYGKDLIQWEIDNGYRDAEDMPC